MKQLTVRGFEKDLTDRIRKLARLERISLNRAALLLMRRGAGLEEEGKSRDVVGNSLDRFVGDWSDEEADEFTKAVAIFEVVDPDAWK